MKLLREIHVIITDRHYRMNSLTRIRVRGCVCIFAVQVRRNHLLEDSMAAMESVRSESMRQRFRFEFLGEPGVDAGGVAREWFHLVSEGRVSRDFWESSK